jgi:hypothetical protein
MSIPSSSNYFFSNPSELFQDFRNTLWSTAKSASSLPRTVLTSILGSRGEAIANFTSTYFHNISNSVHSEFIIPPCSLHSLKESCLNWGFTSNNQTSFPSIESISHLPNENATFFQKLAADFTSTFQSAFDYMTGKYIRYGLIFALAIESLLKNGLNYKEIKKSTFLAASLTLAEMTISRYGILKTLSIASVLFTTLNKGIFSGIKYTAYLGAFHFAYLGLYTYTGSSLLTTGILMLSKALLSEARESFFKSQVAERKEDIESLKPLGELKTVLVSQ